MSLFFPLCPQKFYDGQNQIGDKRRHFFGDKLLQLRKDPFPLAHDKGMYAVRFRSAHGKIPLRPTAQSNLSDGKSSDRKIADGDSADCDSPQSDSAQSDSAHGNPAERQKQSDGKSSDR